MSQPKTEILQEMKWICKISLEGFDFPSPTYLEIYFSEH
jgi:hypothetical protein